MGSGEGSPDSLSRTGGERDQDLKHVSDLARAYSQSPPLLAQHPPHLESRVHGKRSRRDGGAHRALEQELVSPSPIRGPASGGIRGLPGVGGPPVSLAVNDKAL